MFKTSLLDRNGKPERTADQAWQQLMSTFSSAGDSVRGTARSARRSGSGLADEAGDMVGSVADEARRRATQALDALAGRRPSLPWALLLGAALAGAAIGWAAGAAARAAGSRDGSADDMEFVDVDRPNSPVELDG